MINIIIKKANILKVLKKREYQHSIRVAEYTYRFGIILGLNIKGIKLLFDLALYHDIGKGEIADDILNKKETLTDKEYIILRQHPIFSERFLLNNRILENFAYVVRAHHERWDGKGYPDGLSGVNIPFLSRIISIADVYDALTSERVYRKRIYTTKEALDIIINGSGSQFDPKLTKLFVENINYIESSYRSIRKIIHI